MNDWTEHTSAVAITNVITATLRGERLALRRVMSADEADADIKCTYGFVVRDFERSPLKFPATRAVVDLAAYAAQNMRIPHPLYQHFLKHHIESGLYNPQEPS